MGRHRLRHALEASLVALLTIGVAGCSPATDPPSTAVTTTVSAGPSSVGTVASRLIATINIANPDGLVEVGGAVWVKTDDGRVVRIDPRTDRVTGTVHLDTATDPKHYCQGIGTDGSAVWACTAGDSSTGIVRIDPETMATGKPVAVGKVFDQLSLPHTSRGIWVLTGRGDTVTVVDPASGATVSYPLGARCQQLAASSAVVVATCAIDDAVVTVNPATGGVLARASLPAPRIAAATGHDVWIDTTNGLTRLGTDLKIRAVYPHQTLGLGGDLAIADGVLWARGPGGVLWRIDPIHNLVADQLTTSPALSGGSLLATTNSLWASANDEGVVLHLRRTRS